MMKKIFGRKGQQDDHEETEEGATASSPVNDDENSAGGAEEPPKKGGLRFSDDPPSTEPSKPKKVIHPPQTNLNPRKEVLGSVMTLQVVLMNPNPRKVVSGLLNPLLHQVEERRKMQRKL